MAHLLCIASKIIDSFSKHSSFFRCNTLPGTDYFKFWLHPVILSQTLRVTKALPYPLSGGCLRERDRRYGHDRGSASDLLVFQRPAATTTAQSGDADGFRLVGTGCTALLLRSLGTGSVGFSCAGVRVRFQQ